MKKVLIITYYWPPSGGAGVQRWLKFVKYLREYGWEPIVYTPEEGEFPETDESLQKDVPDNLCIIKRPIIEPYTLYKLFTGQKKDQKVKAAFLSENKKPSLTEKISVWIRGNLFIPDARLFWINPSVKFLSSYLKENPVDAIISTGPPHSMHLIAEKLKERHNINWIADFRDPWTDIDFYKDLMLTKWADKKHHRLEKSILSNADRVITIGPTMAKGLCKKHDRHYDVITNGFDDSDITDNPIPLDNKFSIAHIGTLVKDRSPEALWQALKELTNENQDFANDFELKLVGRVDIKATNNIEEHGLSAFVNRIKYLPHDEVTKVQRTAQVLLLLLNNTPNSKGILTGKFFEYMAARRPILAIGPIDGDAAHYLNETKAGKMADFADKDKIKAIILELYSQYKAGTLKATTDNITEFSRKGLTGKLAEILNNL